MWYPYSYEEVIAFNPTREIRMLRKLISLGVLLLPMPVMADAAPGGCHVAEGDPYAAWVTALVGIGLAVVLRKR